MIIDFTAKESKRVCKGDTSRPQRQLWDVSNRRQLQEKKRSSISSWSARGMGGCFGPDHRHSLQDRPRILLSTNTDDEAIHQRWSGINNKTCLATPTAFHYHNHHYHTMLSQARFDLVAVSFRTLAFMTLIVADSNASPILQTLGSRGTGITSSDENLMSVKV